MKIVVNQIVEAPVDQVWATWDDFGVVAKFAPNLSNSFLLEGSAKTGLGARRQCDMADGKNHLKEEIVEYIPGERLVIDVYDGTMPVESGRGSFDLERIDDDTTRVTMTMDFEPKFGLAGKVMMGAMKPMFRSQLQSMLQGNADYIESGKVANRNVA